MFKFALSIMLFIVSIHSAWALESADRSAIQGVIQGYADAWNLRQGRGFADGFAEDADFVNIFGMKFTGRDEIEERHINVITTLFKGSTFEVLYTQFREVRPGLVIASVHWKLDGFRNPGSDLNLPGETREGIFTQVFIRSNQKWEITASQNTLKPK